MSQHQLRAGTEALGEDISWRSQEHHGEVPGSGPGAASRP